MGRAIFFLTISITFINANAQGPNPMETDSQAVKNVIETFFEGFHKQDSLLMKSTVADGIIFQTVTRAKDGKTAFKTNDFEKFLTSIVNIPDSVTYQDKLTSFSTQVDGMMANVWVGYEFWLNGEFGHCGTNSFQLTNFNGNWKIVYFIDTRDKKNCSK